METFGDALIVVRMVMAAGQGPLMRLYRPRWDGPELEHGHP